ncbi:MULTISPECIES: ethanolamine permease [unclassified Pseudoalteromonas]|jgi:ethanolamine permease|uniref:ethanolamine permease n=1 Tax=unclassified Pseudoalteromonas TaxID=194690 RepID=UPI0015FE6143|nr:MULTISPECIES: ethanolamine permease [unclassified Pseudoalteromonas]MBB1280059.1 ethanolamine permease [Pseudoalteromonas sp. SR41-1]MBB1305033.1 ethanolamine permease [Pseudoalteromonas sp. SR43-5]MBB1346042.1 ethanolamine permease [Pseudoalteromonas sp. SG45-2]MBB1350884.1 ethanolamine permease [Pseudoalteromonas sp. SG45-3]MBB1357563.1 ethanolamine permease [Pseudoalteromonas sp. SG45-6]
MSTNNTEYLAKRQLKRGTAGWLLLAGLGVSYVISGDFAGWNFGIAEAGWGGFAIAAVLMAVMYLALVLSLAEMSAAIPAAGGGYSFARQAMGPAGGYLTGLAVLIEYALAPAAIVIFIGSAVEALTGFNGPWVYALFYLLFVGIHLAGVGEALKVMMVISGLAVLAIIATAFVLITNFDASRLFDVPVTDAVGASEFLPLGWYGVWAALPFAMWLFLAVEGVPLAAEEAKDPAKDVPKGIIGAMIFLLFTAFLVVVLVPGAGGAAAMGASAVPLVDALNASGSEALATVVNILGLAGLVASFFSIIYGYSRLVFALSRAGYLSRSLSITTNRKVPARALIVPAIFGFLVSLSGEGDLILAMAVVGATVSYALMALSHILLRVKQPDLPRPYKTPGGVVTSSIALVLSLIALTGVYAFDPRAFLYTIMLFIVGAVYYFGYSSKHLVAKSADEEFAMLADAESDLEMAK